MFDIDMGIDQLLMEPFTTVKTSHPGRMAPNTAICFVLYGVALLGTSMFRHGAIGGVSMRILAILVTTQGIVALIGYLVNLEAAYSWSNLTRMAVHGAFGFTLLGLGMLCYNHVSRPFRVAGRWSYWFPGIVTVCCFIFSVILWEELRKRELDLIQQKLGEEISLFKQTVSNNVNHSVIALRRMAQRWETAGGTPELQWRADAGQYVADHNALSTIEWVDSSYHVRWVEPVKGNEKVLGLNIAFSEERRNALKGAADEGRITITPPLDLLQGYRGIISYVPIHINSRFDGFIVGIYDTRIMLESLLSDKFNNLLGIRVMDGEMLIYERNIKEEQSHFVQGVTQPLQLFNRSWEIFIWPTRNFIRQNTSALPEIVLFGGGCISLLAGMALHYALVAYRRNWLLSEKTIALADGEELYRSIVESIDGLIIVDRFGVIEKINPASEHMFGYNAAQVVGKNVTTLIPGLQSQQPGQPLEGACYEMSAYRGNGSHFIADITVNTVTLSSRVLSNIIVRDISERRIAEEKFKEARAFQNLIMNNIPDMLFVKDAQFRIVAANPTFINAYPQDRQDSIIGHTALEEFSEEEQKKILDEDRRAFKDGYYDGIENIQFADGRIRTLYTKKIRFYNPNGELFLLGMGRDITELVQAEKDRERLIEKLTESNTELERFAYVASHDMQEPLRMVVNFSAILQEDLGDTLGGQAREYLGIVVDAGRRMQDMLSDLLEYSRVGNEAQTVRPVDSDQEMRHVLQNLQAYIKERNAVVTYDNLPQFDGNPIQIMRLLQNLVTNAIKYQPDGNIPKVHVGVENQDTQWLFKVSDNGLGIDEKFIQQIFVPFKRLHSWDQITGTGLGLAICKKIVENHGGTIWVTSTPAKGSIFYFTVKKLAR
ncbi:MAG: ATP-binding protein [Alphaproteobacteria bacterium]